MCKSSTTPNYSLWLINSSYDGYFDGKNRTSGMDALGLGFMTGDLDDEEEEDIVDKHKALAAATTATKMRTPPPQYNVGPIAAPKPGYAAPISALNLAAPEKAHTQPGYFNGPSPAYSPSIGTPHPLDPPLSPITPAFARPRPAKGDVSFSVPEKPIMRGDAEETLLPRRGERGDDFWRRFSMVAREENRKSPGQKQSTWLRKTQDGTNRLARWVWIVGIILILAIAAGIGFGWYFSHNSPPNEQPTAFGGSANQSQGSSSTLKTVGSPPTAGVMTTLHVSPTNTVARRASHTHLPRRSHRH